MTLASWWLYVTAVFLISATPGPNMLHVMTRAVQVGPRRAVCAMAGLLSAVLLCLVASAAGLGALLGALPGLFDLLRIVGAAYLLYLGVVAWRSPVADEAERPAAIPPTATQLYRAGLFTGLANPKLIIFAAALFPQFINRHAPFGPQIALLIGSFVVIECIWYAVYALGGARLALWLRPARRQRLFNRATGGLFMLFGGLLLVRST